MEYCEGNSLGLEIATEEGLWQPADDLASINQSSGISSSRRSVQSPEIKSSWT
jgi:hypothetical protein